MENLFNDVSSVFLYRMPFKEIFKIGIIQSQILTIG